MAQTAGILSGTVVRLYVAGTTPVGYATGLEITFDRQTENIIHKDNVSEWQENDVKSKSATFSVTGFKNEDGTTSSYKTPYDLWDLWDNGTETTFYYSNENAGDTRLSFTGVITGGNFNDEVNTNSTFSFSGIVTGAITKELIT